MYLTIAILISRRLPLPQKIASIQLHNCDFLWHRLYHVTVDVGLQGSFISHPQVDCSVTLPCRPIKVFIKPCRFSLSKIVRDKVCSVRMMTNTDNVESSLLTSIY